MQTGLLNRAVSDNYARISLRCANFLLALEIMGSSSTKRSIIDTLMHESKLHGFRPVHVKNESVGYVYNRIWAAIKREVLLELSEGVATPAEIDAIFKDILNAPKGPCEQMDVVGLDVVLDIEEHYADVRGNIPTAPREYLKDFIAKSRPPVALRSTSELQQTGRIAWVCILLHFAEFTAFNFKSKLIFW